MLWSITKTTWLATCNEYLREVRVHCDSKLCSCLVHGCDVRSFSLSSDWVLSQLHDWVGSRAALLIRWTTDDKYSVSRKVDHSCMVPGTNVEFNCSLKALVSLRLEALHLASVHIVKAAVDVLSWNLKSGDQRFFCYLRNSVESRELRNTGNALVWSELVGELFLILALSLHIGNCINLLGINIIALVCHGVRIFYHSLLKSLCWRRHLGSSSHLLHCLSLRIIRSRVKHTNSSVEWR